MQNHTAMKKMLYLLIILLLTGGYAAQAQKVKLLEGKLDMLKSEEKLNLEYDYSDMGVGKFKNEDEYITKKKADYDKKEPGRGDQWESSWKADRKNRFQPQFEELFNKHSGLTAGNIPSAKYTLIFKTTYTEPGYNIYVSRKNAEINGEALLVETANKEKVIARLSVLKCPGRTFGGNDYDTGERIQEAYAVAGKGLGKFFKDKVK